MLVIQDPSDLFLFTYKIKIKYIYYKFGAYTEYAIQCHPQVILQVYNGI